MSDGPALTGLTVYFDAECALCARLRHWLGRQRQLVPIAFAPAQAPGSCPLSSADLLDRLTVIGSNGAVWRGVHAWLVCLWALEAWRGWSLSLASPALLPFARKTFDAVSRLRRRAPIPRPSPPT